MAATSSLRAASLRFRERLGGPRWPSGVALTDGAPHVRAPRTARDFYRHWLIALVPCAVLGAHSVGRLAILAGGKQGGGVEPLARGERVLEASSPLDCLARGVLQLAPLFLAALVAGALWERLFAALRRRALLPGLGTMAALYALLLPPELSWWQAGLGMSFGVVIGKEILGGTGMHVVHPVVVALTFLFAAYPGDMSSAVAFGATEEASLLQAASAGGAQALAERGVGWWEVFVGAAPTNVAGASTLGCLLGAAWLLLARVASWRVMAGALVGMAGGALLLGGVEPGWQVVLGGFAFGTVFLSTDPSSAACTRAGRWLYGLLLGFLVALIRTAGPGQPDGTVAALLLASILAPLIDQVVVRVDRWRRARRAGAIT